MKLYNKICIQQILESLSMDRTGHKRPSKLRQWANESMEAAMRAVYDGEMGVNQASREYGVPESR